MRLDHLRIRNFRQHAETDLTFGPGITAIIGPNGTGKTTLLEAIAWAFYGTPAARGTRDFIRWNRAPARARVEVEVAFGLGAHEYRVVRSMHGAELYQDGGASPVANSAREVTARIERILGMTRDEFFHTYFTGQKDLAAFQAMGPTDRARFLSRVLGYEKLKLAQDHVRERRGNLRAELAGLESGLGDPEALAREVAAAAKRLNIAERACAEAQAALDAARVRMDEVAPAWERMVALRDRAIALESDRRAADQHVDEARRAFERIDRDLAEALAAQARLKEMAPQLAEVEPLRAERERLDHEARGAQRRIELTGQRKNMAETLADLERKLGETVDVEERVAGAREVRGGRQEALTTARDAWQRDKADAGSQRRTLLDQYKDVNAERKRIETAGAEGACPTCRRPLGEEYADVVATLTRQLEDIELNGKFFKRRLDQLEAEPDAVRVARLAAEEAEQQLTGAVAAQRERVDWLTQRDGLAARIEGVDREIAALPDRYDADRHDAVRAALKEREPLVEEATRFRLRAERAEQLVKEAETAEQQLSAREAQARQLADAIAVHGFRQERYDEARAVHEVATRSFRDAELAVVERTGDRRAAAEAHEAARRRQAEREARATRLTALKVEVSVHEELDRGLGDLRTDLNAQLRPELADLASRLLAEITDGRYAELELSEQYDVLVLEEGEPKPVISGGEEDIAHLVLRLAISQMVAERAGQPLSMLVLDEIFGSLDEHRRQHVVSLLRGLADRFPQVILITHIESVRDAVDRVLRVRLDTGRGAAVVTEDAGADDVAA